jgi:UDP-N-acetylglucosamine 2-epimerase (non-hydrolysing)
MKKILTCVGTRPNFIKVMRLKGLFEGHDIKYELLHTGQHFDENMSQVFLRQLGLGEPDHYLGVGGGTNAEAVARVIEKAAAAMGQIKPDMVVVPGDVNSTFACAFAASSLDIPVAHIESGLRSFDMSMPEEKNRILTDRLSSLLFVTEPVGVDNLRHEGIVGEKVKLNGNTIIDALISMLDLVDGCLIRDEIKVAGEYFLFTFHRPVNVDDPRALRKVVEIVRRLSAVATCVFPIHPRTKARIESNGWLSELQMPHIKLIPPVGYIEFLSLMKHAACLVSDSGGVQVESSYLGVPLVTVRETTECRITLERGTNSLCPLEPDEVINKVQGKRGVSRAMNPIEGLWDGRASERLVEGILTFLS